MTSANVGDREQIAAILLAPVGTALRAGGAVGAESDGADVDAEHPRGRGEQLRSIVAPLMLMATVILSFAGSLGLSALVFDHGFGFGGVAGDMFIYIFVFLVALGVDYNIFLMDRIREERRYGDTRAAVLKGLTATGGVIVLAGTFSALAQLPDVTVAEVGIAVGIGVLVDTLLVRSFQVPALVILLGDRVWWPTRRKSQKESQSPTQRV